VDGGTTEPHSLAEVVTQAIEVGLLVLGVRFVLVECVEDIKTRLVLRRVRHGRLLVTGELKRCSDHGLSPFGCGC
jgi:hypothetical protein